MKTIPKVSVIMSVRNGDDYLKDAIKSILRQTYTDFEFIIINDASTDRTSSILRKYNDKRIKIFTNKRKKGLTKSLNFGLNKAKGQYIARMDYDDIAKSNRLSSQVKFLEKNKSVGIVGSWVKLIDCQGKSLGLLKFPISNQVIMDKIFEYNPIRHSTVMFRKELIQKYGLYDEKLDGAEDYDLWLRLGKYTKLANINLPLLSYRLHLKSVSEKEEKKVLCSAILARFKAIKQYEYASTKIIYLILPLLFYFIPKSIKKPLLMVKNKLIDKRIVI